jgi:Tol biopolymer transport system component
MNVSSRAVWLFSVALATLVVVCALALSALPAHAAAPPTNGRIAFESNRPAPGLPPGFTIYTINPDGSSVSGPLVSETSETTPAYSPDGTRIAWATFLFETLFGPGPAHCGQAIGVMNADGSNPYQVANRCLDFGSVNGTPFAYPAWSPDGSKLAFMCTNPLTGEQICTVNAADGSGFDQLTNYPIDTVFHPTWSPGGSQIAYTVSTAGGQTYQVHVMNSDGSNDHAITPTPEISYAADPAWSPDGTKIAFTGIAADGNFRIFEMNPDGSNPVQITPSDSNSGDKQPAWSPDGKEIAFASSRVTETYNIWTMNADGSNLAQVTDNSNTNDEPNWGPQPGGDVADHLVWSPSPIAATGSLPGADKEHVLVVTAYDSQGNALPGAPVYLSFQPAPDGSASAIPAQIGGVSCTGIAPAHPLGSTLTRCQSDNQGTITVYYNDSAQIGPPAGETDTLTAALDANGSDAVTDTYSYAAPPTVTITLATPNGGNPNGQNAWFVTAPVTGTVTADARNTGGGNISTIDCGSLALTTSGLGTPTASGTFSIATDGITHISCTATDSAGNTSTAVTKDVKLDRGLPTVTYAGNTGSYGVLDTVAITCTPSDTVSGIGSSTCSNLNAPGWTFGAGAHTLQATATDRAGNTGSGSTSFTVNVAIGGLCQLTTQFVQSSAKYQGLSPAQKKVVDALAKALCNILDQIVPKLSPAQKQKLIQLYKAGVQALVPPGWLTQTQATTLGKLADAL